MRRFGFLTAVACVWGCLATGTGRADVVVNFSYSGSGSFGNYSGTGSLSFASGLTTVGLSDLISFSYTQTFTDSFESGTFDYGLADLTGFAATVAAGPALTALSLQTDPVSKTSGTPPGDTISPQDFSVTGLGTDEASTSSYPPNKAPRVTSTGTITITSITDTSVVPEPASLTLASVGVASLIGYGWRRRTRRAIITG